MKGLWLAVAFLGSVSLARAEQESPSSLAETRFFRVHLLNGNVIDGDLIKRTDREVILRIRGGDISIRQDLVDSVEYVTIKSYADKAVFVPTPAARERAAAATNPAAVQAPASKLASAAFQANDYTIQKVGALLAELRKANPEAKLAVLENLVAVGGDTGPYLASLLDQLDSGTISVAAAVVVRSKDLRSVDLLLKHLENRNALVRTAAASALGGLGDERATPALVALLADKDPVVRTTAVSSLADIGGRKALAAILPICAEPDSETRIRAVEACFNMAARLGLQDDLLDGFTRVIDQAQPPARSDLLRALGRLGKPDSWRTISQYLGDDAVEVRSTAAGILAAVGPSDAALPVTRQLSRETDPKVRVQLAIAARKVGASDAVDGLIRCLRDDDEQVRNEALASLSVLTGMKLGPEPTAWENWRASHPSK
jgi:HEAT repeat protein